MVPSTPVFGSAEESVEEAPTHQTGLEKPAGPNELLLETPTPALGARTTMNPSNCITRTRPTIPRTTFIAEITLS